MPRPSSNGTPARAPNKRKLTDLFVSAVKPGDRAFIVWDQKQAGLALAVQPTGSKAWKFVYRSGGKPRWLTFGNATAIGLADARRLAAKAALQVAEGGDPQAEKTAARGSGTLQEWALRYRNEYASKRNKSWKQPAALMDRYILPHWAKLRPGEIKRADVAKILARLDATPALANQVLAAVSALFSWLIKQEVVEANPCRLVERNATKSRERVLSDSEIAKFWEAFESVGAAGFALKLNLLTGQRPGEVTRMRREHIDGAWWTLPGAADDALGWPGTKNCATHSVWLSEPVQVLLSGMDGTGFVFPNSRSLDDDMRTAMREICAKLGVERATPHDLRRTFSSKVTALGFGRDAMNRITNHREGGIADVYDRHRYADENKRIMEAVARHIVALAQGGDPDNVIEAKFAKA
jgi:integrase